MNQPKPDEIALVRAELAQARNELRAERSAKAAAELALSEMTEHFRAARRGKLERGEPWPDPLDPHGDERAVGP